MSSAAISTISLNVLINLGEFTHARCLPNSTELALQTNNSICFHCGVMQALCVHASGGCWSQHTARCCSVIYQETNVLINISFIFLSVEVHHAWKCVCSIWQDEPIKNSFPTGWEKVQFVSLGWGRAVSEASVACAVPFFCSQFHTIFRKHNCNGTLGLSCCWWRAGAWFLKENYCPFWQALRG